MIDVLMTLVHGQLPESRVIRCWELLVVGVTTALYKSKGDHVNYNAAVILNLGGHLLSESRISAPIVTYRGEYLSRARIARFSSTK